MSTVLDHVKELSFWDDLTKKEQEYLMSASFTRSLEKGAFIQNDTYSCLGMVYVTKGSVRVFMTSEEGREITFYRLETGDACVLSAACVINQLNIASQMMAIEDTEILVVPAGALKRLADENIYLKNFMLELSTERLSTVAWVMEQIIFTKFDRRMATFLINEYERTGETTIRMTQEQIAVEVNSAREVVARMLKAFANEGLIEFKRGLITLKDIEGLEELM